MATPTAKSFNGHRAKNYMLTALIDGIGDTSGATGTWAGITHVYADTSSQTSGTNYSTDFDGYASLTWGTPASGTVSISNTPVLTILAGTTINYLGLIETDDGGSDWSSFINFTITAEAFTYQGTITVTSLTLEISDTIGTPA